jgi:alpha-tubulin suppressor-like RCC1 family protein
VTRPGSWIEVSTGSAHTCAVRDDDFALLCFGANGSAQLGSPNPATNEFSPPGGWREVAAGHAHTCAIDVDGDLFCWGANEAGQAGGATTGPGALVSEPTFLEGGPWLDVAAGYGHSCAIDGQRRLFCWGLAADGQTGAGADVPDTHVPRQVMSTESWTQVAAGVAHTCGLTGGRLFCFGGGPQNGHTDRTDVPTQVGVESDWIWIGAGNFHTCGVRQGGGRRCFGMNEFGQLGDGTSFPNATPTADPLDTLTWAQLDGGTLHTCGLTTDNEVACFGANDFGQVSPPGGQTASPVSPLQPGAGDWTRISANGDYSSAHTCAIRAGALWCWGRNDRGQAGIGFGEDIKVVQDPEQVGTDADWVDVKTGRYHSCGLKNIDELWCWGANDFGQIAAPAVVGESFDPRQVPGSWAMVALGGFHTCAVEVDGASLQCWGNNDVGQLGLDRATAMEPPTVVTPPGSGSWVSVYAGHSHTCATLNTGSPPDFVYCWGSNSHGQIGNDMMLPEGMGQLTPTQVLPGWGPEAVDGGDTHTCLLHSGTLFCFGDDGSGQLGLPNPQDLAEAPTPLPASALRVSAGIEHTCATVMNGKTPDLYCFGSNNYRQLGRDQTIGGGFDPTKVDLGGLGVLEVTAGPVHTCAIVGSPGSNNVVCWGDNAFGQLGDGNAWLDLPERVELP